MYKNQECPVSGRIAAWARVSKGDKDVESQLNVIKQFAKRQGCPIVKEYVEYDRKRWNIHRSETWRRALADAEAGEWDWLVVDSQSRIGTANPRELFGELYLLSRDGGARVWSCEGLELTDPSLLATLTAASKSEAEVREQELRAGAVLRGMYLLAQQGCFLGAEMAYGYDRICLTSDGKPRFRAIKLGRQPNPNYDPSAGKSKRNPRYVSTYEIIYEHGGHEIIHSRPAKGLTERYIYAVSLRPEVIETARMMFRLLADGLSHGQAAKILNAEGPDESMRGKWTGNRVKSLRSNPIYIGRPDWLQYQAAVYRTITKDGQYIDIGGATKNARERGKMKLRPEDQRLSASRPELRIIDDETFYAAQTARAPERRGSRAPRHAALWLAPWLRCGACGGSMLGCSSDSRKPVYRCAAHQYAVRDGQKSPCFPNRILAETLAPLLKAWLEFQGASLEMEAINASPRLSKLQAASAQEGGAIQRIHAQILDVVLHEMPDAADLIAEGEADLLVLYQEIYARTERETQAQIDDATEKIARYAEALIDHARGSVAHGALLDKIRGLEAEVLVLKGKLVPLHEQIGKMAERLRQMQEDIRQVQRNLELKKTRKAAILLDGILDRIEIHGRDTGCRTAPYPASVLERVVFVPKLGQPWEYKAAATVDQPAIREAVLTLRSQGLSFEKIAREMASRGAPTLRGAPWTRQTAYSIWRAASRQP